MIDLAQAARWYARPVPPPPQEALARTACEAMQYADAIGFPVTLTLVAPDAAGTAATAPGLNTTESVRRAYRRMIEAARVDEPGAQVAGVLVRRVRPSR